MERRHYSSQSGSGGPANVNRGYTLSRKKAPHPNSRKLSDSSSLGSNSQKVHPYASFRKERDLPRAYNPRSGEKTIHLSNESVVEVLSPLKSDISNSPETSRDLVGEYRRRLYKRGDLPTNRESQRESQDLFDRQLPTSHSLKSIDKKAATKVNLESKKPSHYLQFSPRRPVAENSSGNSSVLEKLMRDIVNRIQSYESNFYRGYWCDKNDYFRSKPRADIQLRERTFVPSDEDVIPPSELHGHITALKEDMSRLDASSSYRLSCLEQLMKLNRLLQYTDGFVRVRDLKKKGISFVRTETVSSQHSGSTETSMAKTSPSESSIVPKMKRPKSFEGSTGNFKRLSSDVFSRTKSHNQSKQAHSVSDRDLHKKQRWTDTKNRSSGRRVRYDKEDNRTSDVRQVRYDKGDKSTELHLPPLVNEEEKGSHIQEICSEHTESTRDEDVRPMFSTDSVIVFDGKKTIGTKAQVIYEKVKTLQPILKNSKASSSKVMQNLSIQSKEASPQPTKKQSRSIDHGNDWNSYAIEGKDLVAMGKGQLLQAIKNLVETPYYKLDSVIYKLRKELEQLSFAQEDKKVEASPDIIQNRKVERSSSVHIAGQKLIQSGSTVASLAKHVVDDFVFDKDKPRHSMTPHVSMTTPSVKTGSESCIIEEGRHSLHSARKNSDAITAITFSTQMSSRKTETPIPESSSGSSSDLKARPSQATCNFRQVKGVKYYMYLRHDDTTQFSMLSPEQRGETSYRKYLGSYVQTDDNKMVLLEAPCLIPNDLFSKGDGSFVPISPSASDLDVSNNAATVPGINYYRYEKKDGSSLLTTISPRVWGSSCPYKFIRAYRETKNGVVVPIRTDSTTAMYEPQNQASSSMEKKLEYEAESDRIHDSKTGKESAVIEISRHHLKLAKLDKEMEQKDSTTICNEYVTSQKSITKRMMPDEEDLNFSYTDPDVKSTDSVKDRNFTTMNKAVQHSGCTQVSFGQQFDFEKDGTVKVDLNMQKDQEKNSTMVDQNECSCNNVTKKKIEGTSGETKMGHEVKETKNEIKDKKDIDLSRAQKSERNTEELAHKPGKELLAEGKDEDSKRKISNPKIVKPVSDEGVKHQISKVKSKSKEKMLQSLTPPSFNAKKGCKKDSHSQSITIIQEHLKHSQLTKVYSTPCTKNQMTAEYSKKPLKNKPASKSLRHSDKDVSYIKPIKAHMKESSSKARSSSDCTAMTTGQNRHEHATLFKNAPIKFESNEDKTGEPKSPLAPPSSPCNDKMTEEIVSNRKEETNSTILAQTEKAIIDKHEELSKDQSLIDNAGKTSPSHQCTTSTPPNALHITDVTTTSTKYTSLNYGKDTTENHCLLSLEDTTENMANDCSHQLNSQEQSFEDSKNTLKEEVNKQERTAKMQNMSTESSMNVEMDKRDSKEHSPLQKEQVNNVGKDDLEGNKTKKLLQIAIEGTAPDNEIENIVIGYEDKTEDTGEAKCENRNDSTNELKMFVSETAKSTMISSAQNEQDTSLLEEQILDLQCKKSLSELVIQQSTENDSKSESDSKETSASKAVDEKKIESDNIKKQEQDTKITSPTKTLKYRARIYKKMAAITEQQISVGNWYTHHQTKTKEKLVQSPVAELVSDSPSSSETTLIGEEHQSETKKSTLSSCISSSDCKHTVESVTDSAKKESENLQDLDKGKQHQKSDEKILNCETSKVSSHKKTYELRDFTLLKDLNCRPKSGMKRKETTMISRTPYSYRIHKHKETKISSCPPQAIRSAEALGSDLRPNNMSNLKNIKSANLSTDEYNVGNLMAHVSKTSTTDSHMVSPTQKLDLSTKNEGKVKQVLKKLMLHLHPQKEDSVNDNSNDLSLPSRQGHHLTVQSEHVIGNREEIPGRSINSRSMEEFRKFEEGMKRANEVLTKAEKQIVDFMPTMVKTHEDKERRTENAKVYYSCHSTNESKASSKDQTT